MPFLESRPLPRFRELIAVEQPEEAAYEHQDGLIDWPWDGERPEGASPSKRSRDAPVANDELDCPKRSPEEGAHSRHAIQSRAGAPLRRVHDYKT
jgi:hypothetical protein